jgi:hypothetical protein
MLCLCFHLAQRENSEVLIKQDITTGDVLNVECHGTLSDGSTYTSFPVCKSDDLVGRVASDDLVRARDRSCWVKAKLNDESYLVSSGEGFNVWNCVVKCKRYET